MATPILAVLALWRDSSDYLERSLAQFDAMETALKKDGYKVVYGFFENDSIDDTPQKLQSWIRKHTGFVISECIGAPKWGSTASLKRVTYQARYRNMALKLLNEYYNFDYLLVADTDVHWQPDLIQGMIKDLDNHPKWGMVSPNTVQNVRDYVEDTDRPSYFDSWSLKDEDDNQCLTFAANPFLRQEDRELWKEKKPVYCNSAFGSIAMVKAEAMDCEDGVEWAVINGVEHWEFCAGIRSNGYDVVVDPLLHAEIIHKKEVVPHPDIVQLQKDRLQSARAVS